MSELEQTAAEIIKLKENKHRKSLWIQKIGRFYRLDLEYVSYIHWKKKMCP